MNSTGPEAIKAQKISATAVRERTGRDRAEWFALLDAWGAAGRGHREIARWLAGEHRVDSWSSQSITVAYEQARGLRAPGQQADGYYAASASRTVAVPVDRLFEAFTDELLRRRWLPEQLTARPTTADFSFRADFGDGTTRIAVGFVAKGATKAQVGLVHEKLVDAESAAEMKALWRLRLTALKDLLES
jgi:uncharacterized protein YndB with AHSA1/START domain